MEANAEILAARAKLAEKFGKSGATIGGKGSQRRKVKAKHQGGGMDDKKLQGQMKRLGVNSIPGIEEVNMFKEDNSVIHFENPKVQANIGANTYVISGSSETKNISELAPQLLSQMGPEGMMKLARMAEQLQKAGGGAGLPGMPAVKEEDDDGIPEIDGNFDQKDDSQEVD